MSSDDPQKGLTEDQALQWAAGTIGQDDEDDYGQGRGERLRNRPPPASMIGLRPPPPPSIRPLERPMVHDVDEDEDVNGESSFADEGIPIHEQNIDEYDVIQEDESDKDGDPTDSTDDDEAQEPYDNNAALYANATANDHYEHYDEPYQLDHDGEELPPGVSSRDAHEDAMMRMLAFSLRRNWVDGDKMGPDLERRLHDFRLAQKKRRERYGNERPWGILGLYDHLAGIRADVEWAEDAAWRRDNREPYLAWSDFEDCRDSGFNRPFFTIIVMIVCTALLVASIGVNGWKVESFSSNPMIGPSAETLIKMGAKQTNLIVNQGEWFRLFSPMILHAGLIHYLLNMLALWFIGSAVEQNHGFVAAAIIFIIPAAGGTILSAIFLPEYISVGASGGIFGLIGACFADIVINWRLLFSKQVNSDDQGTPCRHIIVVLWLVVDIIINCVIGLTPYVDNFTHMGGMVYGFLCGLSTMERLSSDFFGIPTNMITKLRNIMCRFMGLILSVILIMVTTAVLVDSDGVTSPCSNCRYASCVKFPPWNDDDNKWWYCDDCATVVANLPNDSSTGYIESMTLNCPDGTAEFIDLAGEEITDREWLSRQLPNYCRDYCENVFK